MASCSDARFLVDGGMIGAGDYDETPRRLKKTRGVSAECPFGPLALMHLNCDLKEPHAAIFCPTGVGEQSHKSIQAKVPIPQVPFGIVQTCDTEQTDQRNALAHLQGIANPSRNLFLSMCSPAAMPDPGKEMPLGDDGQQHGHFLDEPETLHLPLGEVTGVPLSDNDCCWDTPRFAAPMPLDVLPICAGLLYQAKTTPAGSTAGKLFAEDFATPRFVVANQDIQEFSTPDGKGLSTQNVAQDTFFADSAAGGTKIVFAEELDLKLADILPEGNKLGKGESKIMFADEVDLKLGDILPEGGSKIEFADELDLKLGDILAEGPLAPARQAQADSILACDSEGADSDFATPRRLGESHTAEVPGVGAFSGSCLFNRASHRQSTTGTVPACNGSMPTFQDMPLMLGSLDLRRAAAVGQGIGARCDASSEAGSEFSTPRNLSRACPTSTAFFNKECAYRSDQGRSGKLSDISWFTQSAPTLPGLLPRLVPSLKSSGIEAVAPARREPVTVASCTSKGSSIGSRLSRTSASSSAAGQQFARPASASASRQVSLCQRSAGQPLPPIGKALGRSASASKLQRAGGALVGTAPEQLSAPLVQPLAVSAFPSGAPYYAARWLAPFAREPGPLPVL